MTRPARSSSVLLAIDIGNSTVDAALFRGRRALGRQKLSVRELGRLDRLERQLRANRRPQAAALCSVNPPAARKVSAWLKRRLGLKALRVGLELPVDMPVRTSGLVGADRLCNAVAAYERVGGACIVVGCGTAITVDAVSQRGEFLGGAIACGPGLAARALHEHTALLPPINLRPPSRTIGRNTAEALRSGLILGAAGAIERLAGALRKELGGKTPVLATGGDARALGKWVNCFDMIVPGLALEGISILYERHVRERLRHGRRQDVAR